MTVVAGEALIDLTPEPLTWEPGRRSSLTPGRVAPCNVAVGLRG